MAYSKALIVDDSKLARITLKRKVEALGLSVILAESGEQAIAMVNSESPDIVFMDHLMPDMDGFEATQILRADTAHANLPIIMCSGKDHAGYLDEAKAIGASQTLSKPPTDDALSAVLATDFSAGSAVLDVSAVGAQSPILDDDMLIDDDFAEDDLLSGFSADSLDIGTNVIESTVPQATPVSKPAPAIVGIDEAAVQVLIEAAVATARQQAAVELDEAVSAVRTAQQTSDASIEAAVAAAKQQATDIDEVMNAVLSVQQTSDAAMSAVDSSSSQNLPMAEIESLCQTYIEKERISLVAEILASVPDPQMPEFDVPSVDYDRVDRQIADAKAHILSTVDEQLSASETVTQAQVVALIEQKQGTVSAGLSEDDVHALVNAAVKEQANQSGAAISADLNHQLKQREKILLQHLEVSKASVAGLLAEVQGGEVSLPEASNNVEDELDILRSQYQQLAQSSVSKPLVFMGLGLGVLALGLAVLNFFA